MKRERPAENPPVDVPKPGTKPWPGYPKPMPPGKDWLVKTAKRNKFDGSLKEINDTNVT